MVVLALVFLPVPYRVEGSFTLKSDQLEFLTAPFDGYIDEVLVRPGDVVKPGQPLLKFKTSELALDESFALADLNRFQREAEKARASQALADMRVAEAMAARAAAQLELTRYRLREATITSTFDGVVIEGDLREKLGSPVKRADTLFQVARIDRLYVEAQVNERDAHEVLGKTDGEIAFVAQPKHTYPVRIETLEPAAVAKPEGNYFLVRCTIDKGPQSWWRPGMSGVCKFPVGKRTLGWVLTHRTVDFLRLKLWW
jgi:multidrug resistance efflux pump